MEPDCIAEKLRILNTYNFHGREEEKTGRW